MITTNALLIIVMQPPEPFITIPLSVMTRIHALINLVIQQLDVFSLMLDQRTVMIITFVPLMDAQLILKNVFTLLSTVMTTILALLILVTLFLDANTLQ
jgi:hypothetical protein